MCLTHLLLPCSISKKQKVICGTDEALVHLALGESLMT
jgi:hypothetical protein